MEKLEDAHNALCDAVDGVATRIFGGQTTLVDNARLKGEDNSNMTGGDMRPNQNAPDDEMLTLKDDNNDTGETKHTSLNMTQGLTRNWPVSDDDIVELKSEETEDDVVTATLGFTEQLALLEGEIMEAHKPQDSGDTVDAVMACTKNGPVPSVLNYDRGDVDDTVDAVMEGILNDCFKYALEGDCVDSIVRPIVSKLVGELDACEQHLKIVRDAKERAEAERDTAIAGHLADNTFQHAVEAKERAEAEVARLKGDDTGVEWATDALEIANETIQRLEAENDALKEDVKTQGTVWFEMQKLAERAEAKASKWETTAMREKSRREKVEAKVTAMKGVVEAVSVEKMAEAQHKIWASWMQFMFSNGGFYHAQKDLTASWQMYSKKYERWQRQMHTSYADLSEEEKGSDVEVVKEHYPQLMEALNKLDEEAQR